MPVNGQVDEAAWMARFGGYDVRRGTWTFFPNSDGC
jgi:hypothetical protein